MRSNNDGRHLRWRPSNIGTKQEWQGRNKNIRMGNRAESPTLKVENPVMANAFYDENAYILYMKNDAEAKSAKLSSIIERLGATNPDSMPPSKVMKQLAAAVVLFTLKGKGRPDPFCKKSSVLCEREDNLLTSEPGGDE
ncbi:hypothetical protein Tsubulata_031977, partial [Turnera subulata]